MILSEFPFHSLNSTYTHHNCSNLHQLGMQSPCHRYEYCFPSTEHHRSKEEDLYMSVSVFQYHILNSTHTFRRQTNLRPPVLALFLFLRKTSKSPNPTWYYQLSCPRSQHCPSIAKDSIELHSNVLAESKKDHQFQPNLQNVKAHVQSS